MHLIIPMAGHGRRFAAAGFSDIKPLITVDDAPMISQVMRLFPGIDDPILVCLQDDLDDATTRAGIESAVPGGHVVGIADHDRGPVLTLLAAAQHIPSDEPVIVNYCDFSQVWDYEDFVRFVEETECDGAMTTYRGFHPHTLGSTYYAYLRERNDGTVTQVREKAPFTDNPMSEGTAAGTFYFRSGALLLEYLERAVAADLQVNGEFYVSLVFNLMIEDGLDVRSYDVERFLQWGTPEDLREYQGWSDFFREAAPSGSVTAPKTAAGVPDVVMLMAGEGRRFVEHGHQRPKPIIPAAGVPMWRRAAAALPGAEEGVFITTKDANDGLTDTYPRAVTVSLPRPVSDGPLASLVCARGIVDDDHSVLVAPCDIEVRFDPDAWDRLIEDESVACAVWVFRNHPPAIRDPDSYAWVDTNGLDIVDVRVKERPTEDPREALGMTGIMWFRNAATLWQAVDAIRAADHRICSELTVDSLPAFLSPGELCRPFVVDRFVCFGTPDELRTMDYWAEHFTKTPATTMRRVL